MEFMYKWANLPGDRALLERIDAAAARLHNKLAPLDLKALGVSEYNQRYLGGAQGNLHSTLQRYGFILAATLSGCPKEPQDTIFMDYGGGSGVLALLAREAKLATVLYNDIYDVSCRDAELIGTAIGCRADHYVCGSIEEVLAHCRRQGVELDALGSWDVLEHIYDVEAFLGRLAALSSGPVSVVMATGVNPRNRRLRQTLMRHHLEVEYHGRPAQWGHKQRDCLEAYLAIRRQMVRELAGHLDEQAVEQLARTTRGLMKDDIATCVQVYEQTGQLPAPLAHPTNTCDPLTGNWAEHLMDLEHLRMVMTEAGFDAQVRLGCFSGHNAGWKRWAAPWLNGALRVWPGLLGGLAPWVALCGVKPGPGESGRRLSA